MCTSTFAQTKNWNPLLFLLRTTEKNYKVKLLFFLYFFLWNKSPNQLKKIVNKLDLYTFYVQHRIGPNFNSTPTKWKIIDNKIKSYSFPFLFYQLSDNYNSTISFIFFVFSSVYFNKFFRFFFKWFSLYKILCRYRIYLLMFVIFHSFSRLYYRALSHGHINSVLHYGRSYTPM